MSNAYVSAERYPSITTCIYEDLKLTHKQVIALRFASDEKYLDLVERARSENLSPDEIKKTVQHWRADHHRVKGAQKKTVLLLRSGSRRTVPKSNDPC
ncbi:DUF6526 family protein [Alkalihalobacillus sp. TS-13]|uniref:DUF6526 family protein n=1 Tax=Alkalihalobacillus sp. TS-13 TaxID=2842455 RepID=UPI001C86E21D|nr:DUF6526 family protein [Alkalihalobacillus sp. TS-13]